MNLYYKYFIRDTQSTEYVDKLKNTNEVEYFEIADYSQNKDTIFDKIKNIYSDNKIYHSQNKKFAFFYYYSNEESNIWNRLEKEWFNYWESEFKYSNDINCKKIIIHFLQYSYPDNKITRGKFIKNNNKYLEFLFMLSKKYNVKIYFENSFERNPEEFNDVIKYLDDNFDTDYGICYDIGHSNVWGNINATTIEWIEYIALTGKDIHYHLHTNTGMIDSHQSISKMIDKPEVDNIKLGLHKLLENKMIKNATLEVDYFKFLEDSEYLKKILSSY